MLGLDLLRSLLLGSVGGPHKGLPANELRFVLEYPKERTPPDLAAERKLISELVGANSFGLAPLFPNDPDLAQFIVLSIPGVERTLPPHMLIEIAQALLAELKLVSCEPDLGIDAYRDPDEIVHRRTRSAVADRFLLVAEPGARKQDGRSRPSGAWRLGGFSQKGEHPGVPTRHRGCRP